MTEVAKIHVKQQVVDTLRSRNGLNIDRIHDILIGSNVLV